MQEREILECSAIIQTADQSEDDSKMFSLQLFNSALVVHPRSRWRPAAPGHRHKANRVSQPANKISCQQAEQQTEQNFPDLLPDSLVLLRWLCANG